MDGPSKPTLMSPHLHADDPVGHVERVGLVAIRAVAVNRVVHTPDLKV